jgi:glycosyltransferase involved in cell wall biosynthesis
MPSLLQIVVEGNRGSTGRIAESLGEFVLNHGWESYIAYGRFSRPSLSKKIKIGTSIDVFLHGISTRLFDRHGLGSRRATKSLIKKIEKIKPDIIHLHHLHGYYINIEILFNYLSNTNQLTVWSFHDCWSITGHCCHFDYIGCEKWKTECGHCPQSSKYPSSLFVDRSTKNYYLKRKLFGSVSSLVIVSVSNWLNSIVSESFLSNTTHQVIYNGIDLDKFSESSPSDSIAIRKKLKIVDGLMILGVANTWDERKGFKDFLELSRRIGSKDRIVLVGLNKSQMKSLSGNIIGIKRTESVEELKDLYSASDVYVNLSVEETFGLTTVEALSCGTPAIVYDATACPEIIDINTGFVVQKHNIEELLASIEVIRKQGRRFYSNACRDRAVRYFDKKDRLLDYFELYKKMIFY